MRPTLVHGIILFFLAMATAAFSKTSGAAETKTGPSASADSSTSVPDKKPARSKPEKSTAPLAKPEAGEDVESEDTQEEAEEASDCDGCLLARDVQVIMPLGLAATGSASVSALPFPG